jgi:NAD(P)-dependent dehydrogenase (short-subunit alcohol dehydrogenase family)
MTEWVEVVRALEVGVGGAYQLAQSQLQRMVRARRGTVVNILSASIHDPVPKGFGGYVLAKQALRGFTVALAAEYVDRGLRVFSVSPPYMETPLTAAWSEQLRAAMAPGRADVSEIAREILALVRDPAVGLRGEDYRVPRSMR